MTSEPAFVPSGGVWPSPDEALLLRAAVLADDRGREAWGRLRAILNLEALHGEAVQLLPLLYRNLAALGVEDARMPRLKGSYRRAWYANQLLLPRLADALQPLERRDIAPVLLGGVAMWPYYHDEGARPLGRLEVLVAANEASRALETLAAAGWDLQAPSALARRIGRAPLRARDGTDLLLHWRSGPGLMLQHSEPFAEVLRDSRSRPIGGRAVSVPIPEHLLLILCATGPQPGGLTRLRWAPDASLLLRTTEGFDWDRALEAAARWRLLPAVRDALHYLSASLDVDVPADVLTRLRAARPSARERLAHRLLRQGRASGAGIPPLLLAEHLRWTAALPPHRALLAAPAFARARWGIEHAWHAPRLLSPARRRAVP